MPEHYIMTQLPTAILPSGRFHISVANIPLPKIREHDFGKRIPRLCMPDVATEALVRALLPAAWVADEADVHPSVLAFGDVIYLVSFRYEGVDYDRCPVALPSYIMRTADGTAKDIDVTVRGCLIVPWL